MVKEHIQKSQHLIKGLVEDISFLNSLMSQVQTVSKKMMSTWTAIYITYENFNDEIKDSEQDLFELSKSVHAQLREIEALLKSIKENNNVTKNNKLN